jgi:hypothetical protein
MPHSPEKRDVIFSGVDEEGKIATGGGRPATDTSTDPTTAAAENGTSHDTSSAHVATNGHSTHSASNADEIQSSISTLSVTENGSVSGSENHQPTPRHIQQHSPPPSSLVTPEKRRHQNDPQSAKSASDSIKLDKEVAHLKEHFANASPKALQKLLRDDWRNFFFEGASLNHLTFVFRALLKNASSDVINRVGDDLVFKGRLLDAASNSNEVIRSVWSRASTAELLTNIPAEEIDKIVTSRLKTVPARDLIRWLAESDRLGYQMDDTIEDDGETVMPNVPSQPPRDVDMTNGVQGRPNGFQSGPRNESSPNGYTNGTPPMNGPPALSEDPILAKQQQERHAEVLRLRSLEHHQWQQYASSPGAQPMHCPNCRSRFYDVSGFNYHVSKKVCHKEPNGFKFSCLRCYQGFSTKQGQEYHCKKEVCASNDSPPLMESQSGQIQMEATATASARPPMMQRTSSGPVPVSAPAVQHTHPTQTGAVAAPVLRSQRAVHQPAVAIQRPPLHTPGRREPPSDVRQPPSELSPERLAALNQELQDEDAKYHRLRDHAQTLPPGERESRLISLKNGNASKKSQIRKKFGVSLRLREKDKAARRAVVAATPPPNPRLNSSSYMASPLPTRTSSAGPVAPTTGFSPINTARRNNASPANGHPYGAPPSSFPAPQRPSMTPPNGPLRHAQADQPSGTGFGMLVNNSQPRYSPHNQMTTSSFAEQQRNGKRRRSEDDDEGRQSIRSSYYSANRDAINNVPPMTAHSRRPRMSMMELSSENAASKYPKKSLAPGQSRSSAPNGNSSVESPYSTTAPARASGIASRDQDTPMNDPGASRQTEPVYISSEGEDDAAPEVRPRPSSSHEVLPSIEGSGPVDPRRGASVDSPHGIVARRGSSARLGGFTRRGDTTEDEGSRRGSHTAPADDPVARTNAIAERMRIADEVAAKYPKRDFQKD